MTARKDAKGKRALFETPPIVIEDSDASRVDNKKDRPTGDEFRGSALIDCSSCGSITSLTQVELGIRVLAISLWVPGRTYNRYIQCPSCQTRTWCRVEWFI